MKRLLLACTLASLLMQVAITPVSVERYAPPSHATSTTAIQKRGTTQYAVATTPRVSVQSPPSSTGSRPSASAASTASATRRATATTAARLRAVLPGSSSPNGVAGRSPRSWTSTPAVSSRRTKPAARSAAGAPSCPAWCPPALVGTPMIATRSFAMVPPLSPRLTPTKA